MHEQPPSVDLAALRAHLQAGEGPAIWRSLEQLAADPAWQEQFAREFPPDADAPAEALGRRSFLKLMAASLAFAGLTACTQPRQQIAPYTRKPEELVIGNPLFYATAMPFNGYGRGLVVRSNEGRPTKIEGNPDHPDSLGATDIFAQAAILTLYDPDRSQNTLREGQFSTWEDFLAELAEPLAVEQISGGTGLCLLSETITSPTILRQIAALREQFPQLRWFQHEPVGGGNQRAGAELAFGEVVATRYDFAAADVILSLDGDFLAPYPGSLNYARAFAGRRNLAEGAPSMNRLYVIEPTLTITGAMADNRLPLRAGQIEQFARTLASSLGVDGAGEAMVDPAQGEFLAAVVADLQASRGSSIVLAGEQQSPAVHALAHALNAALGNVGSTVFYSDPVEVTGPDGPADLSALVEAINSGTVRLLVVLGSNPVYSAPADLRFAEVYGQVPLRVHLGLYHDETAVLSNWHIPEAHFLEAWGDVRAFDGSASIVQPLIDPLYSGRTTAELLSALGGNVLNSYDLVRETWEPAVDETAFEPFWKTSLASGMIADTALPARAVTLQAGAVAGTTAASEGLELCLRPDPTIWDGRWANNGWLQELHKPITTLTWDNAALVSPRTAERLGVQNEDLVELRYRETVLEAPIWIMPGQADDVVTVTLGYGRTRAGNVGTGLGVNGYLLRYSDALWYGGGLELVPTGRSYPLASTQTHWSMEGRHIVQAATFEEYQQDPHFAGPEEDLEGEHSLLPEYEYPVRWAMSINLTTCIGCNACTIACQAENNIPIVGKDEVRNSRELHWIRVDRYYTGSLDNPRIYHMPVPCMHCEKAPCEIVCPVAATVHDQEGGLNQMVYNRCVGTKYCSNNCPYKVRRFNFYEYSDSPHETIWMQRNPDVTVRARGVMEKCTYCVQRINRTRINARREQRLIGEDEFTTACAQVCPTEAIVFGDMAQPSWRISRLKQSPLNYGLLGELNTQPRTSYQAKVTNPTPALAVEARRITEARNATEATERDGTATP